MSSPLKKVKKAAQPIPGGPQVEAIKPKPSINMIGQNLKRPVPAPGTSSNNSSPSLPVKKPRLDFSSTATATRPQPTTPQSTAHLRPALDELHKPFCEKTEVDYDGFEDALDDACTTGKFNKAVRMICAALRDVERKKDTTGVIAFEENVIIAITKTVKEHGESLKNVNLSRSIFYLLGTTKGIQADKQSLLMSWITHLTQVQDNSDPVIITSYLHDALGERCWVDKAHSLELVTRILRYFGTRFPTRSMYNQSGPDVSAPEYIPDENISPLYFGGDDEETMKNNTLEYLVKSWEHYGDSPPRHLLRTMNAFAAFPEVRLQAARKIDGWLQNAKLQRVALEVLLFLGCNIEDATKNDMDRETLSCLLKLRSYKSKMVTPVFAVMIKELLAREKMNLNVIIRLLLNNEFGHPQHRFHLNMQLLYSLFHIDNKNTTKILGSEISFVIAASQDNYKSARLFIRELVRSNLRTDFLFSDFAYSFMNNVVYKSRQPDPVPAYLSRLTVDICTWLPLVAITQQVKDAFANRRANGIAAPSAMETINKFQSEMREYYRVVIQCLNALHPLIIQPEQEMDFPKAFYRMLFLDAREKLDSYSSLETGTSDEIGKGIAVILECPINEKLICLIAKCDTLSKDDRLNLIDKLINNAIVSRSPTDMVLPLMNITTLNVFETLFRLAEYKEGLTLDPWFWKTWRLCLLLLCATPPPSAFTLAYNEYPMIRMLTKMILLGNFSFPLNFDGKTPEVVRAEFEKQKEEESVAASHESSEESIQKMMCFMNPTTSIRGPSREIGQEIAQVASFYGMPAELAQLRSPDLLSKLIEEEGSTAAMPAIQAVIVHKPDSFSFIPVICITQFLLHHLMSDDEKKSVDDSVILQMGERVRKTVGVSGMVEEGKDSFLLLLSRLASGRRNEREAAVALLAYLFTPESPFPLLGQPLSLDRLASAPFFDDMRTLICFSISDAFRVESEPSRLDLYVRFITKYGKDEELHRLSILLSHSSTRHDDTIRSSLIHFFARYVDRASESRVEEGMKMVTMEVNGRKISLVSSTLFFILEMLSRFGGGGEGRDRLLSIIISPNGALPTVIDENGSTIELLNDQLRGAMLSSTDESIVKVALGRVDSSTSFNMICTFGLTTFSASNLLKNLDALDESSFFEIPNAKRALPFVIAYRKKGAQGGEKFLSLLTRSFAPSGKEEPMDECDSFVLNPPPSFECSTCTLPPEITLLTKIELTKKLKEMVTTSSFALSSLELRSATASEANTDVCLECLELNLKFFFSHVGAFNDMIQLLCGASEKYPSVKVKLRTLCAKMLKSAAVPQSIEPKIKELADGPAPVTAPKSTVVTKKPLDLKCATAEDLLETLHKRKNMTNIERARLINRFVLLRPEIIDIRVSDVETDRQIGRIFGVQAIDYRPVFTIPVPVPVFVPPSGCFGIEEHVVLLSLYRHPAMDEYANEAAGIEPATDRVQRKSVNHSAMLQVLQWPPQLEPFRGGDDVYSHEYRVEHLLDVLVIEGASSIGLRRHILEYILHRLSRIPVVAVAILDPPAGRRRIEGHCREGLDRLVAQLWLRASPETIECILKRVLIQYNQSISPSAVMDLLRHCASSPSYLTSLGREELKTACAFMVEKATEEFPLYPEYLLYLGDFIATLIPITGFTLLEDLAVHCIQIDRSNAARERRVAAGALLTELQKRFPCLHVSSCSTRISIEGIHNGISSADKELTTMLGVLFECNDDSEVASAIDSLTHIIHFNKKIVLRQLPVMSRLIARISEKPSSQIKECRRFRWIINFLISSMMDLMDSLPSSNTIDLDRLIDGLLDFYQKHVSGTRDEKELSKRILSLIDTYLTNHRTDAREFIQVVGGDRVSGMLSVAGDELFEEIKTTSSFVSKMHPLAAQLSQAESTCETLERIREVENCTQINPQKSEEFSRFLVPLFCSPSSSVRRHSLQSAITALSTNPQRVNQIVDGYRLAIGHSNIEIVSTAMDYLPQMVTIVGDHSSTLISCAVEASHRHFSPSQFTSIIAKTVHIARGKKDEEPE
ncbi:inst-1 [Pristionchus pacificus]|uniref:Inst-1 n=1 Tax=Pristionchus pacificus TaxID=54126 RepID=A0A2A6BFI0_PRIPA|nr:inst-1 [Pristionchus pacificus]|eukprot:PDM64675.1 inst-1 [Pristionchus pacificus]